VFAQIDNAIETLDQASRHLEPDVLEGRDVARLVEKVSRGERLCAAMKARLARRVEECNVWKREGFRSAAEWLAAKTRSTIGSAVGTLETARALDALPATSEAFRAGELSEVQAREVASAAVADPDSEQCLLETAAREPVSQLKKRAAAVRLTASDDERDRYARIHRTRHLRRWSDRDGAYCLRARLRPDLGAKVDAALEAHLQEIFAEACREGRRERHECYAADALVALAEQGPRKPPEVRVVVDVATITSPTRTIPAGLRRALELKYPVCVVKGCGASRNLQIDHVRDVTKGGPTSIHNLW
jgi:hypothetical protein